MTRQAIEHVQPDSSLVGLLIRFPWTGSVRLITAVDREARTLTFAVPHDLEDSATETWDDLVAVDVEVLPGGIR